MLNARAGRRPPWLTWVCSPLTAADTDQGKDNENERGCREQGVPEHDDDREMPLGWLGSGAASSPAFGAGRRLGRELAASEPTQSCVDEAVLYRGGHDADRPDRTGARADDAPGLWASGFGGGEHGFGHATR